MNNTNQNKTNTVTIHINILNEDVATVARTEAQEVQPNAYKILPTTDYNPEAYEWEFVPGDIVRCKEIKTGWMEPLFLAVEKVG